MLIRQATRDDLAIITELEQTCFPPAEAANLKEFRQRLEHYANHFWLLFEKNELLAFIDGMATNQADLQDILYQDAALHDENGAWQMIFGVNTHPDHRQKGYAGQLIQTMIADARQAGRKGLVLTCKESLLSYYARFGFQNEGLSSSTHGNVEWYQMRLTF